MSTGSTTILALPRGQETLDFTGERFTPEQSGPIAHEHLHRYLFALQFCEGKRVLDVASGEGYGTYLLSRAASSAEGLDVSEAAVAHAAARYRAENLGYRVADCAALPVPDASIDVVVSFETLEHVAEQDRFLSEVRRVLGPSGVLVLSSPDRTTYSPPGKPPNPFHVRELTAAEFEDLVSRYFAHAVYGGQRATAGSLMLPAHGSAHPLECFSGSDLARLERGETLASPVYVVAVASQSPLPAVRWSILDDPGYVPQLLGTIDALRQDNAARVAQRSQQVADHLQTVRDLSAELGRLAALEQDGRKEVDRLRADNELLRVQLEGLVRSRSWTLTRPLRDLAAVARGARSAPSLRHVIWNAGRAIVGALPPAPRERIRALKRRAMKRLTGGEAPGLDRPALDEPRVSTALKRALSLLSEGRGPGERYTHALVVPHLKSGGADLTAMNYLRVLCEKRGPSSCLLILADSPDLTVPSWIPAGVRTLRVDDLIDAPDARERVDVLNGIIRMVGARVVHNVNSVAGWNLFIHRGEELAVHARLFGSIFAFQFGAKGEHIGYAAEYFERSKRHLTGLITDNRRFARDVVSTYRLDGSWSRKIHVVYNPSRAIGRGGGVIASQPATPREPLRVLWAGRLDAEKLPEVLQSVSERAGFATFDVFGSTIVDGATPRLAPHERLRLRGPFSELATLFADGGYDAFVFTSKWEGMPNILLEVGAHGIPVVAPDVGGVPELVGDDTGYLVRGARNVEGYVEALESIRRDPAEAARRARNLLALVNERHSWATFAETLEGIPDYA
ncbi:methyltransferase domain-containing protein [Anaeromyxobacter terrae]|uniref:methyltransferase domain-containing protein n=1 Tax=Anaeromyxobacter terrae TaxID=2925406 RepID=UPI001F58DEC5|nr:methyltransferase domain-containing protein [Anaeromyxobacter sp. SG22]